MPVSPQTRAKLGELYHAVEDRVLPPGDAVYVAELNASDDDPVQEMATEIEWQQGGGVCLFTGQRGTGKSTELKRLQDLLQSRGMVALYVDMSEYVLLTKPIEISDFLISIAGAMSDRIEADPRFGQALAGRTYWERLRSFFSQQVKVDGFDADLGAVDLKISLKDDPDFKKRVQESARGHVAKLVREAHSFFADAVRAVQTAEHDESLKVVLIVDSVERIRGVGGEATSVYESVRNLFLAHGDHLRIPTLHVVYTVPPYLSVLAAGAGALMGGANVRRLSSTHMFRDRSRDPDPAGLKVMRQILTKRFADWNSVFAPDTVDRLALQSGGDLREFFRLLRRCLPAVRDDRELPLQPADVKRAESDARNEMLPIPHDQLVWLKRITLTHDTCLASDQDLATLAHFLDNRLVLNYRNGTDWYDVHPLIRQVVDDVADVQPAP